jgi:glycosyltransferase involved in cell wall biosynthesis
MGKRNRVKAKSGSEDKQKLPFVSICTPTFNRRPFIKAMIANYMRQDYPQNRMEWIIIDDGSDKIEDLVKDVPGVKYFAYDVKMSLGKKRNLMHEKSCGDILVYMDDDDYYPACRVSHAVEKLQSSKDALCAGSSEIYIWFKHINKMYQFGPYNPNHATAGTFAFKRKLLKDHQYEDHAALAEEKAFLKNYTVPFVQLDPLKTILVFSHEHNTFDKRKLLDNPHPQFVKESDKTVDMFIKEAEAKHFYMEEIEDALKNYEPGRPSMKPDVLEQMILIEEKRRKEAERMASEFHKNASAKIVINTPDGKQRELQHEEVVQILTSQQNQLKDMANKIAELEASVSEKDAALDNLRALNRRLMKKVKHLESSSTCDEPYKEQTLADEIIEELFS